MDTYLACPMCMCVNLKTETGVDVIKAKGMRAFDIVAEYGSSSKIMYIVELMTCPSHGHNTVIKSVDGRMTLNPIKDMSELRQRMMIMRPVLIAKVAMVAPFYLDNRMMAGIKIKETDEVWPIPRAEPVHEDDQDTMMNEITSIGCVVCSRVILVVHGINSMTGFDIKTPYKGKLMTRFTTCCSCMSKCSNTIAMRYGNTPIGTNMIIGSSMYRNVVRYFGTNPRIYQVGKFNVIESMSTIRRDIPTEHVILVLCTTNDMTIDEYDNELFLESDSGDLRVSPSRTTDFI
ncbi:hypothetical protein B0J12DRAFT_747790 [Macrophomina phaseolina]|uniref:Uncharacterized protein n=1 Tax=Macrophomina phaseolina TaxID=35725 RepID=A0ABQ8FS20_9PEZI|nr:hypothetical protein B0J12DRAFT_747790 [Macrophomina phaseolina]